MPEAEPKSLDPEAHIGQDRLLYVIVKGVISERNKKTMERVDGISDPGVRLNAIRQEQWLKRDELRETFDVSGNYREVMQVLGLLEEREERITGETNEGWVVRPTIKKVETEIKDHK